MNTLEEWAQSEALFRLYAPAYALSALVTDECLAQLESAATTTPSAAGASLLLGYKLVLATAVCGYLDEAIRNPQYLDVTEDNDFSEYFVYLSEGGRESRKERLLPNHELSRLVARVEPVFDFIRRISSFSDLKVQDNPVTVLSGCIQSAFAASCSTQPKHDATAQIASTEDLPARLARQFLVWQVGNLGTLQSSYAEVFSKDGHTQLTLDEDWDTDVIGPSTRLSESDYASFSISRVPAAWAAGCLLSIVAAVRNSLPAGDELLSVDECTAIGSWHDFDSAVQRLHEMLDPDRPLNRDTTIKRETSLPEAIKQRLLAPVDAAREGEAMVKLLGRRLRIVEDDYSVAPLTFCTLLAGACDTARNFDSRVEALIFRHPVDHRMWDYSFALFMPAYGWLSTASRWWLFFDVANNHSGTASQVLFTILKALQRNRDCVNVRCVSVNLDALYDVAESPGYRRLRNKLRNAIDTLGHMRGALPELLAAQWLTLSGAHPVRTRWKPDCLGGKELDAVGFDERDGTSPALHVMEVRCRANTYRELQRDLVEFAGLVKTLNAKTEVAVAELTSGRVVFPPATVRGYLVTLFESIDPGIEVPDGVELWDRKEFMSRLRSVGVPKEYLSLVETRILAQEISFGDVDWQNWLSGQG